MAAKTKPLNFRLLLKLFVGVLASIACLHLIHVWQLRRNADHLRERAELLEQAGDHSSAIQFYKSYLRFAPSDTAAMIRLGKLEESFGALPSDLAHVIRLYSQSLRREPHRLDVRRRLLPLLLKNEQFAAAKKEAETILQSDPADAAAWRTIAEAERSLGNWQNAVQAYERVVEQNPHEIQTFERLADLHSVELRDAQTAEQVIERLIAANSDDGRAYLAGFRYFARRWESEKSRAAIERALSVYPHDIEVLLAAADAAATDRRLEDAGRFLQQAQSLNPQDTRAYLALGKLALIQGKANEALDHWSAGARQEVAGTEEIVWRLADLLIQSGRTSEARPFVNRLLQSPQLTPINQLLEARIAYNEKRFDQAVEMLLQTGPRVARLPELTHYTACLLGDCYAAQGKLSSALAAYRRASETVPDSAGPRLAEAELLARCGRIGEADAIVQVLAYGAPPTRRLAELAAEVALRSGRAEQAVAWSQLLADQATIDPLSQIRLARALSAAGRWIEAERALEQARQSAPQNGAIWLTLVDLHWQAGNRDKATAIVQAMAGELKSNDRLHVLAQAYELVGDRARAESCYVASISTARDLKSAFEEAGGYFLRVEKPANAETCFRKWLAIEPASTTARRGLAGALMNRGGLAHLNEAVGLLDINLTAPQSQPADLRLKARALSQRPDLASQIAAINLLNQANSNAEPLPNDSLLLARLYYRTGQSDQARFQMFAFLALPNPLPDHIAFYAGKLLEQGTPTDAEPWILRLEAIDPNSSRTSQLRIRALKLQGRQSEAIRLAQKSSDSLAEHASQPELLDAASALELTDAWKQASALYLRLPEQSRERLLGLIRCSCHESRISEAVAACLAALDDGLFENAAHGAALILTLTKPNEKQFVQVARIIQTALKQRPSEITVRLAMAQLDRFQGQFAEEAAEYRHALTIDPHNPAIMNNLAWVLAENLDSPKEALEWINRAIGYVGFSPSLLDTRGVVLTRLNRPTEALADLELASAENHSPVFQFHLARAWLAIDRKAEATKSFQQAHAAGLTIDDLQSSERPEYEQCQSELEARLPESLSRTE